MLSEPDIRGIFRMFGSCSPSTPQHRVNNWLEITARSAR